LKAISQPVLYSYVFLLSQTISVGSKPGYFSSQSHLKNRFPAAAIIETPMGRDGEHGGQGVAISPPLCKVGTKPLTFYSLLYSRQATK